MTSPEISLENETDEAPALRLGTVVAKTSDSLVIMHRYGSAEITLNAITG
jgi:hypothetical protein